MTPPRTRLNMKGVALCAATLWTGACGGQPTPLEQLEQDEALGGKGDVINPTGNENMGNLVITKPTLPNDAQFMDGAIFQYYERPSALGRQLTEGQPLRLKPATSCVGMEHRSPGDYRGTMYTRTCDVVTKARSTTTLALAAFRPRLDAIDFGLVEQSIAFSGNPERPEIGNAVWPTAVTKGEVSFWKPEQDRFLAVLPGTYRFKFNMAILGEIEQVLSPGMVADINLNPQDKRATITIHPPERAFPNPAKCADKGNFLLIREGAAASDRVEPEFDAYSGRSAVGEAPGIPRYWRFHPTAVQTVRVIPYTSSETRHYEYVVNQQALQIDLVPGQNFDVHVKRIDVNDIEVTDEAGNTTLVKGTYKVFRKQADGTFPSKRLWTCGLDEYPTGTGLDVLPGSYKVVVSYTTADGAHSDDYFLDL